VRYEEAHRLSGEVVRARERSQVLRAQLDQAALGGRDRKQGGIGHDVPLLVNMQPAGFYLGEEYHRAGGVPAVVGELMRHKRIHEDARRLTDLSTELGIGLLQSTLLLLSFIGVLWILSDNLVVSVSGHAFTVPGYMVWCALLYSAIASLASPPARLASAIASLAALKISR